MDWRRDRKRSETPLPAREVEPSPSERGLSPETTGRASLSYEMVETRHGARGVARSDAPIDDPDRDAVVRWQAGDAEAFTLLVRRHEARVFRLLLRMTGSREEAEDVSQETFLSLHRHGHRFRQECRFSTFVYRVAANAALNRRRSLKRSRDRINRLEVRQAAGDDLPHSPRSPEDQAAGWEIEARVQAALLQLPDSLRLPVVLFEIEGLPYGEIASVLGLAEGTVKSRIHRARQVLRTKLRGTMGRLNDGVSS